MEKYPIHNPRVTRRGFLGGVGSVAAVGLMAREGLRYEGEEEEDEVAVDTEPEFVFEAEVPNEEQFEVYSELSDSGYFLADVRRYAEGYKSEVSEVLENIDIYNTIQENFLLPNIKHQTLRKNLEALAPAIGFTESRYTNALSEVGAFGVMQLMPGTWEELARDDENKSDIKVQIKVAARLMEQSYRHITSSCRDELRQIEQEFFGGDVEAFEIAFLTPILINSYNAGMGTLENLIKKFVDLCPSPSDTIELFEQSETLTGYDIFIGMAHTGNLRGWAKWYKDIAANYTCKVYEAHQAVVEYFSQQREEEV